MKHISIAAFLLLAGISLMAATVDPGLPTAYWQEPAATAGKVPHDWSALEVDLRPEACAQCHAEQFAAWSKSRHAQAYSSGMVGQFADMGHDGANDCLQCHAPLAEQMYRDDADMLASIQLRLTHADGFSADGKLPDEPAEVKLPLRHTGVSCAACHVRGWQRTGPPQRGTGAVGHIDSPVHSGFSATRDFERSGFCASCHQFPQSMAINGKPLENTIEEWKQSRFAAEGVHCQQCHMPDRQHLFKGIHDRAMTLSGLDIQLSRRGRAVVLKMSSVRIGHAFPTYVTPRVEVLAQTFDADGRLLDTQDWQLVRQVEYDDGWQERRDTRLMPGESRMFSTAPLDGEAASVRFVVTVIPDHFYKGVYRSLLEGGMEGEADGVSRMHIRRALADADANDYVLFSRTLRLTAP